MFWTSPCETLHEWTFHWLTVEQWFILPQTWESKYNHFITGNKSPEEQLQLEYFLTSGIKCWMQLSALSPFIMLQWTRRLIYFPSAFISYSVDLTLFFFSIFSFMRIYSPFQPSFFFHLVELGSSFSVRHHTKGSCFH